MGKGILFFALLAFPLMAFSGNPSAYQLFDEQGNERTFGDLIEEALEADVVFFGEIHNHPISHWLRDELVDTLHSKAPDDLTIGLEMFERDDQITLEEFQKGWITEDRFEEEVKLWPNYETDYKSLMDFALEKGIPLEATNVPRRYAQMVSHHGKDFLDTLSEEATQFMTPLPYETDTTLQSYQQMLNMGHGGMDFVNAQALKDATMAHFIAQSLAEGGEPYFHLNGAFHTIHNEGIVHYLTEKKEDLEVVTINSVDQEEPEVLKEENKGQGDFILSIPQNMTRTH